jgi:Zn-dependent peptidase ImmA (M78 family)/transcriptional regulator with XRE-family HTH domain
MTLKHLKTLREQRHFLLQDVAEKAIIAPSRLKAIEEGDREPSYIQIEKLAAVLGVTPYVLASDTLPNLQQSLPDYRKAEPTPAHLSPAGARRVWQAEAVSDFAAQMVSTFGYQRPKWADDVPKGAVDRKLAVALRSYFDNWCASRIDAFELLGPDEHKTLQCFRIFLEVQGLAVSINDAPAKDYLGFYTNSDTSVPIAFINRNILSKKAQLFTAVHEFAHHLLKADGISNPFQVRNAVERTCNQFAAEFLAPTEAFNDLIERKITAGIRSDVFALVAAASSISLLSKHAAAIRLVECGYLTQAQLVAWENVFSRNAREEKDNEESAEFGQVHAKRLSEIGYLPTYLALQAFNVGAIDSIDVRDAISLPESLQDRAFALVERRFKIAGDR